MDVPTKGRIVLVKLHPAEGSYPAIVTAVHSSTRINARVFVDSIANPPWETSIPHADAADAGYFHGATWCWPPLAGG